VNVIATVVGYLGSAAGATVLVAVGTAAAKLWLERRPRQRIAAIRAAAETRALVKDDEIVRATVESQMAAEANSLRRIIDRANEAIVKREKREPWLRTRRWLVIVAFVGAVVSFYLTFNNVPKAISVPVTIGSGVLAGFSLAWQIAVRLDGRRVERRFAQAMEELKDLQPAASTEAETEKAPE
jgi:hypothetical protein